MGFKCKAITTRSGKQLKEAQETNQGERAPTEPSIATTQKNITSIEEDDINPDDPDDNARVDHEADKDVLAIDSSTTNVATMPQIRFPSKEKIEDV
ncbi:hypothetical protein V6N13_137683 [Hibiscus sabdariffa]